MVSNIDRDSLLLHIHDESKIIIAKRLIDKIEIVIKNHTITSTDFLDPYEVRISESILNKFDTISYKIDGGYVNCERAVIYIYPSYLHEIKADDVALLSYKNDNNYTHRNILGSLMGLGIERNKIGDIVIGDDYFFVFIKKELYDFVRINMEKISRYNAHWVDEEFREISREYIEKKVTVSSLRLDVVISQAINVSRSTSNDIIQSKAVKVNFKVEDKNSLPLNPGDIISIKKFGRIYFDEIIGKSKKDKFIINLKFPK
ncbi:MAG: YlmH/Sll1252 family protein [Peptoniphilus sp.]|nr:YlmH/Sll1252 family protein [Peptoniphilus sp.]